MVRTVRAEVARNCGRGGGDFFARLLLAVKHAQRVFTEAGAASRTHSVKMRRKIFSQRRVIFGAAGFTAYGIDFKPRPNPQLFQKRRCRENNFRVLRKAFRAENFHTELVKLSQPSRLRAFVTEARRYIIRFDGHRRACKSVFDKQPCRAGSAFRL